MTTLGVKGPSTSPAEPAVWNRAATVGGDRRTAAAIGMTTAAMMALPPARVPRAPQIRVDVTMMPRRTRTWFDRPMRRTMARTICSAAPVRAATSPTPAPSTMIRPTTAMNEPSDSASSLPMAMGVVPVMMAPSTMAAMVDSTMSTPSSAMMANTSTGVRPHRLAWPGMA